MNLNGVDITISIQMLCAMNEIDMYALFAQSGGMGSNDLYLVYFYVCMSHDERTCSVKWIRRKTETKMHFRSMLCRRVHCELLAKRVTCNRLKLQRSCIMSASLHRASVICVCDFHSFSEKWMWIISYALSRECMTKRK